MMPVTSHILLTVILATGIVTGLEVRLAGDGATYRSGRVEIRRSSSEAWGTVCDDFWNYGRESHGKRNADVVCRMLGFLSAERAVRHAGFGQGLGSIYLDNIECNGTESDLLDCPSNEWGSNDCNHGEDVGVVCREREETTTSKQEETTTSKQEETTTSEPEETTTSKPEETTTSEQEETTGLELRLAGNGTYRSGRVEIRRSSSEAWGTVCDDHWDRNHTPHHGKRNADVVCRMLGFLSAERAVPSAGFGRGSGSIYLDNIECNGTESDLLDCPSNEWGSNDCNHGEDVGVVCREREETTTSKQEETTTSKQEETTTSEPEETMTSEPEETTTSEPEETTTSKPEETTTSEQEETTGLELRLAGNGTYRSGRVEIRRSSSEAWGTVCDDYWSDGYAIDHGKRNADVVCRMLGFLSAERAVHSAGFRHGSGLIYLDDVLCTGTESDLMDCPSRGWGEHNCNNGEDVGVVCQGREETTTSKPEETTTSEPEETTTSEPEETTTSEPEETTTSKQEETTTSKPEETTASEPRTAVASQPLTQLRNVTYVDGRSCKCEEGAASLWEPSYPGDVAVPINRTTNGAEIKLIVNHVTVKFRQTFGHHRMTVNVGDSEYVVQMNVYDPEVERRLMFSADYSVSCDLLEHNLTNHIIEIQALIGAVYIREICDGDCNIHGEPQLSCVGDTLTIDWLTDIAYSADVTQIASVLSDKLTENIRHRGSVLNLAVHSDDHEIVSPTVNSDGLSLTLILQSSCREENMTYDPLSDRCLDD